MRKWSYKYFLVQNISFKSFTLRILPAPLSWTNITCSVEISSFRATNSGQNLDALIALY